MERGPSPKRVRLRRFVCIYGNRDILRPNLEGECTHGWGWQSG
jgi:hypothetical protein